MKFIQRVNTHINNFIRKHLFFTPYYARLCELDSRPPEIYNKYGERMNVFFLSDREFADTPYGSVQPRYILWDRYNFGLKTHFYSHNEAFNTVGNPDRRYAMLLESSLIANKSIKKFIRNKKYIENEFDAVFTCDDEILNTFNNAKFFPFGGGCIWYGLKNEKVKPTPDNYKFKSKNISIIASDKNSLKLHRLRKEVARKCKREGLADTFGRFDGGPYCVLEDALKDYRFSIAMENDIRSYYFTEKIINCFAAQTVPVYLGATKISEFFNPDGIIQISLNDVDNIEKILAQCTPEEYERRIPAVIDNFNRVQEYDNMFDWLYRKYFM